MQKHIYVLLKIHQVLLQGQHTTSLTGWQEFHPIQGIRTYAVLSTCRTTTKAEKGIEIKTGRHLLRHTVMRCKTGKQQNGDNSSFIQSQLRLKSSHLSLPLPTKLGVPLCWKFTFCGQLCRQAKKPL